MNADRFLRRAMAVALFVTIVPLLSPPPSPAYMAPWIDQVALEVMVQKNLTKGNFDPYLQQLEVISQAAAKGDFIGKRKAIGRFLEMLENQEGGISSEAAHKIFAVVFKTVPYALLLPLKHPEKLDPEEKALVARVERFSKKVKDMEERAALSF